MSATVPMSVWNNVRKYFKEHLDNKYDLQDVIRYASPMDSYLYMVIAKHKNYPAIKASYRWRCVGCMDNLERIYAVIEWWAL